MDVVWYIHIMDDSVNNAVSAGDYKYFISAISGLLGVVLGFLMNRVDAYYVKGRSDLDNFKKCLLQYSRGELGYMDLFVLYSVLRSKDKKKINIEELLSLSPDEKEGYCFNLIKELKK
jgi:hypothetical protein